MEQDDIGAGENIVNNMEDRSVREKHHFLLVRDLVFYPKIPTLFLPQPEKKVKGKYGGEIVTVVKISHHPVNRTTVSFVG